MWRSRSSVATVLSLVSTERRGGSTRRGAGEHGSTGAREHCVCLAVQVERAPPRQEAKSGIDLMESKRVLSMAHRQAGEARRE